MDDKKTLDEVLVSIFKGPNSYTGENTIEISCHGSTYIQQQIIQLLLRTGCRMADPGEFTLRAF
jgi:tRNA modification GTPase